MYVCKRRELVSFSFGPEHQGRDGDESRAAVYRDCARRSPRAGGHRHPPLPACLRSEQTNSLPPYSAA
jgi:hypothetical protein